MSLFTENSWFSFTPLALITNSNNNNNNNNSIQTAFSDFAKNAFSIVKEGLQRHGMEIASLIVLVWIAKKLLKANDPMRHLKKDISKKSQAILKHVQKRSINKSLKIKLTEYEFIIASDIITPDQVDVRFDDIGGLEEVKAQLYESIILPLKYPEVFQRGSLLGIPKGVLLYGPPGTGKTMLAKAIAKESMSTFINVNVANLMQKWLGETEKLVMALFTLAHKLQPSIIFIDEIDSLFRRRSDNEHEVIGRVKAMFMSLWDGILTDNSVQITIIGTTNRPGALDEAIQRRMPHTFQISMPDTRQREQILRLILKNECLEDNFDYSKLAHETDGYSASDLKALCRQAAHAPIRELFAKELQPLKQASSSSCISLDAIDMEEEPKLSNVNPSAVRAMVMKDFVEAKQVVGATGESAQNYEFQRQQQRRQNFARSQPLSPEGNVVNFNFINVRNQ